MKELSVRAIGALQRYKEFLKTNQVQKFYSEGLLHDLRDQLIDPEDIGAITDRMLSDPKMKEIVLNNLLTIPPYFLYGGTGIAFEIPKQVDLIESKAFSHTKMTHLIIPGNVQVLQSMACNSNEFVETVTIKEGCRVLGDIAFEDCPNLKSVTIPPSVYYFGNNLFKDSYQICIYCKSGSEAHRYAKEEGIAYSLISWI